MRVRTRLLVVVASQLCWLLTCGAGLAAASVPERSVSIVTDKGYWASKWTTERLYHSGNSTITVGKARQAMFVAISDPPAFDIVLRFEAPDGELLAPGVYSDAQRQPFRDADRAGLEVTGSDLACANVDGSFEIKELAKDVDDSVERLWLVYEQHCDGERPAVFGEIRIGMPGDGDDAGTVPQAVRWPAGEVGRSSTAVPVTFFADSLTAITEVTLGGPSASALAVDDGCSGQPLSAGGSCRIFVRPDNSIEGPISATLELTDQSGEEYDVALAGLTAETMTEVQLVSDPFDWPGQGNVFGFTPETHIVHAIGDPSTVYVSARRHDLFAGWDAHFAAPDGETLTSDHYTGAVRFPGDGTTPAMTVEAGHACNTSTGDFTIHEVAFDSFGRVGAFDVTFEQHCEGDSVNGLRGSLRFRASDLSTRDFPRLPDQEPSEQPDPDLDPGSPPPSTTNPWRSVDPRPARRPRVFRPQAPEIDTLDQLASRRQLCRSRRFARDQIHAGTAGADRLAGRAGDDLLLGLGGGDRLLGGTGDDCLDGGSGRDILKGGSGRDVVSGAAGADVLVGGPGRDRLNCGRGRDTARISRGDAVRSCERVIYVDRR